MSQLFSVQDKLTKFPKKAPTTLHDKLISCQKGHNLAPIKKLPWMGHT